MTVKNIQIIPPGYTDVLHPETSGTMVLMDSGNNLETDTAAHLADFVRQPAYGTTAGSANAYTFTSTPALPALVNGVSAYLVVHAANTGAATLNWQSKGAKSIVDSKGAALTAGKMPLNCIVGVRYNATTGNFHLLGEGGGGNATAADILASKTATVDAGLITGTMPDRSGDTAALSAGVNGTTLKFLASAGYRDGVNDTVSFTDSNFVADNIVLGKTVFGVTGTTPKKDAFDSYINDTVIPLGIVSYVEGEGVWIANGDAIAHLITPAAVVTRVVTCPNSGARLQYVNRDRMVWYDDNYNDMYVTDKNGTLLFSKDLGTYSLNFYINSIVVNTSANRIYTLQSDGSHRYIAIYNLAGTQIGSTRSLGSSSYSFIAVTATGALYKSSSTSGPFAMYFIPSDCSSPIHATSLSLLGNVLV